jgi:predicted  nucleic acid-binding Zn-ribbon protein
MTAEQRKRNEDALKQLLELRAGLKRGIQQAEAQVESLEAQIAEYKEALVQ